MKYGTASASGNGTPTYTPDTYIDVCGEFYAQAAVFFLVKESVFFTVEPMPDDIFRFYMKAEDLPRLRYILDKVM